MQKSAKVTYFRGCCGRFSCNIGCDWDRVCSHFKQNDQDENDSFCTYCFHRATDHRLTTETTSMKSVFKECTSIECRKSEDPCFLYQRSSTTDEKCAHCFHLSSDHKCVRVPNEVEGEHAAVSHIRYSVSRFAFSNKLYNEFYIAI